MVAVRKMPTLYSQGHLIQGLLDVTMTAAVTKYTCHHTMGTRHCQKVFPWFVPNTQTEAFPFVMPNLGRSPNYGQAWFCLTLNKSVVTGALHTLL